MIFKSTRPSIEPLPKLTFPQWLFSNPFNVPNDREVMVDAVTGRGMTFGQYLDQIAGIAGYLGEIDLKKGDMVAVVLGNSINYPGLIVGLMSAGVIPLLINPTYGPGELAHCFGIAQGNLKAILTSPELANTVSEGLKLKKDYGNKVSIVQTDDSFWKGVAAAKRVQPISVSDPAKEVAMVPFSSGTTGASKGVMLSHLNLVANGLQIKSAWPDIGDPNSIPLNILPLFHAYGIATCIVGGPTFGVRTIHLPRFEPEIFVKTIQKYKVTMVTIVPPVALFLAKHPIVDKFTLTSLQSFMVGAAPLKIELAQALSKRFNNIATVQCYGMTEMSPGTHVLNRDEYRRDTDGSVGQLNAMTECIIVNEEGKECGPGEPGELLLRGPQQMLGYLNNEKETKGALKGGWYGTGDIGYVNKDGYFWIIDRKKELIKVKGFQVPPAELESYLISHPRIADCAVTGKYFDDEASEFAIAYVVPQDPQDAKNPEPFLKTVTEDINKRVVAYKRLREVIILDAIPKNPSGKILRRLLPVNVEKQKALAAKAKL